MDDVKRAVRERYGQHAAKGTSCCPGTNAGASGCGCGSAPADVSKIAGYTDEELGSIPQTADLGLGCGNPTALASIRPGEVVIDLGSGGGIDCFLAAKRVGPDGRVIGVDMTAEMLDLARRNAASGGYDNVEFRLGEIEALPVADATGDLIISNCVINLVPDKARAFAEAFRVLKPGGRLSVSDIVRTGEVPESMIASIEAYVACLGGASLRADYLRLIAEAGFTDVSVIAETAYTDTDIVDALIESAGMADAVGREDAMRAASVFLSVQVEAVKPA